MEQNTTDFVVSELLSELKQENDRKDKRISNLTKGLLASFLAGLLSVLITAGGFLWYLNQYDFSSTTTSDYSTIQTAEGVYAVVDSDGNVISQDLTDEQLQDFMEGLVNGESDE